MRGRVYGKGHTKQVLSETTQSFLHAYMYNLTLW